MYAVKSRCVNVAATATDSGTPAAVSPAMSPASAAPMPPGTGTRRPMTHASEFTTTSCRTRSE